MSADESGCFPAAGVAVLTLHLLGLPWVRASQQELPASLWHLSGVVAAPHSHLTHCFPLHPWVFVSLGHRIIKLFELEKTSKIIESDH